MGARQQANFGNNWANSFGITAINTLACFQDRGANNVGFHFLDNRGNQNAICLFTCHGYSFCTGFGQRFLTGRFIRNIVSGGQFFGQAGQAFA